MTATLCAVNKIKNTQLSTLLCNGIVAEFSSRHRGIFRKSDRQRGNFKAGNVDGAPTPRDAGRLINKWVAELMEPVW